MAEREKVLRLIFEVVDEINETLPEEEQILGAEQTPIFGVDAGLDSLSLLNLILGVETKLAETVGTALNLSEVLIGNDSDETPGTLGALADFIAELEG